MTNRQNGWQPVSQRQHAESHAPLEVTVMTMHMATSEIVSERQIDHQNPADREWLLRHQYWAVRNGHGVQIAPVKVGTTDEN